MSLKKILSLIILLFAIPTSALAADLPNYQKDATLVAKAFCDEKKTSLERYKSDTYVVIAVVTSKGYSYYVLETDKESFYFTKKGNSPMTPNKSLEEWKNGLKETSPGYYNLLNGITTGCIPVKK